MKRTQKNSIITHIFEAFMAKVNLEKIEKTAGLGKADLHVHLVNSTPEEFLNYIETKTDLNVVAVTGHDNIEDGLAVQREAKKKGSQIDIIVGEEITAKEGHILGLFLYEAIEPHLSVRETIKKIHSQGGIAIAAHPFQIMFLRRPRTVLMDGIGLGCLLKDGRFLDAIETVNATPTLKDENLQASLINKTVLLKAETGSSDAHILEAIGQGYTVFKGKTAKDLRLAIETRQTQAIYKGWNFYVLIKYFFFFVPEAWRIAVYNFARIIRREKRSSHKKRFHS